MIKDILRKNGIKATNQRIEVLTIINDLEECSIKEIESGLNDIDISTIYRTIDLLLSKNIIEKEIVDKTIMYKMTNNHKHYINCIKCHDRVELDECPFKIENINGFKITKHTFNIEGICKNCQKEND